MAAKELFTEELARIAKGGKGVNAIFKELDDRLGKIKSTSGKIVDTLEDQLDILTLTLRYNLNSTIKQRKKFKNLFPICIYIRV